jgi:hypothetical protein
MSTQLDDELRAALDDLVDVAPPTGLAAGAIRRGVRRQRLARSGATLGGLAFVSVLSLALVPSLIRGPGGSTPIQPAGPRLPHVVLVYGGIAGGVDGPAEDTSLVLNKATGEYESLPYHTVVPSPDGSRLFVVEGDNSMVYPTRMGILDRATGEVRWLPGHHGYQGGPAWSPDGAHVLLTDFPRNGPAGFTLVDADSLVQTFTPLAEVSTANVLGMCLVWAPGATELLHVLSRAGAPHAGVYAFGTYTVDGTPTSNASFADVAATDALVSPGSTRLLVVSPDGTTWLLATATGSSTGINLIGYDPVAWADEAHILAVPVNPTRTGNVRLVMIDLNGKIAATLFPPPGVSVFQSIIVGSSEDLAVGSEGITF